MLNTNALISVFLVAKKQEYSSRKQTLKQPKKTEKKRNRRELESEKQGKICGKGVYIAKGRGNIAKSTGKLAKRRRMEMQWKSSGNLAEKRLKRGRKVVEKDFFPGPYQQR